MQTPRRSSQRWWWFLIVLVVLAAGWWWTHRNSGNSAPNGSPAAGKKGGAIGGPVPVTVEAVLQENFEEWVSLSATVTPLNVVTVHTRVDGELDKVHFTEGQMVKAGALLAEIDPRPFQAVLDQAKAAIVRDQALQENARVDLARYAALVKEKSIPKQQLDTQASLVQQYEATIASDRATIASAELQLIYTKVTSPLTGRVGLRQIDPGNIIHASDANGLVIVTQMDPMGVVFSIPQELVTSVRNRLAGSDEVPVEVMDKQMKVSLGRGKLVTTDNQIDLTSGTLKLKAVLPNPDGALFPNQFVIARLLVDKRAGATVAPATAVQRGAKGAYAYVLNEDSTVSLRNIATGATHKDHTLITDGLKPGDQVITRGVDRLRDGAKVTVIRPDDAPASDGKKGGTRRGKGAPPQ